MTNSFKLLRMAWVVSLSVTACKKAHDHDHLDIGGFRIISSGQVIAEQNGTTVTSSIVLPRQTTSSSMNVEFRDPEGKILTITDNEMYLEIDTNNPGVVLAQKSTTSKWSFTLSGVGQGSAGITIKLMHGNHADFESRSIPVTVN